MLACGQRDLYRGLGHVLKKKGACKPLILHYRSCCDFGHATQEQLAAEAGIAPPTVSNKIEKGRRCVRSTTLRAVQDALKHLGVDVTQNGRTGHHAVGTCYD